MAGLLEFQGQLQNDLDDIVNSFREQVHEDSSLGYDGIQVGQHQQEQNEVELTMRNLGAASGQFDDNTNPTLGDTHQATLSIDNNNSTPSDQNDIGVNTHGPVSPWRTSSSKQRIIDELKDEKSDIHLLIGPHTSSDFKDVNFKQMLNKYAGNKYKLSNFKENIKRLLLNRQQKTGPFKAEGVEPWYTSPKNVSRGYSLLFMLLMDSNKSRIISTMAVEEIWKSHPQFQLYELDKFKTYFKNMKNLTAKRKERITNEEASYCRDMIVINQTSSGLTIRGYPFWHTHTASKLLKEDVAEEMAGVKEKTKPSQFWRSRTAYQDFPLHVFRKHIYQERTKQLAAPYWQHKRNQNARKRYEETAEMLSEWEQTQANTEGNE